MRDNNNDDDEDDDNNKSNNNNFYLKVQRDNINHKLTCDVEGWVLNITS